MKYTRLIALLALLAIAVAPVAAFDWGGYLDNTTGVASAPPGSASETLFIQSTTLALWAKAELGTWDFETQGSYTFTPANPLLLDIDGLTLDTDVIATDAGATTVGMTAGRDRFRDATGYVLSHTLDGVSFRINQARSSFRLGIGTNALLLKPTNQIILGTLDILDYADTAEPTGTWFAENFAPARLIGTLDYRMLEVIGGQHLTVAATFNQDLRPQDQLTAPGTDLFDPSAGGRVDTQYVSLVLSGALAPGLFQTTYYTLNSGRQLEFIADNESETGFWYQYQPILAHMAGLELTYFLPEVLNSRARLFAQFSTGDSDWADKFVPLSPSTFSDVFTLQPGNSAHLGVSYSLRPLAAIDLDVLQTELRTVSYFRTSGSGEVSEPSVDPLADGTYVGSDINLVVTAVPFSDLRLVLKSGLFVPNANVMSTGNQNVDYQVTLQGVLRF